MRTITILSMITLDGVIQAPGGPGEDPSNGFNYGGWVAPFGDETYGKVVQQEMQPADYLLGRHTYEIFAGYWPQHTAGWPAVMEGTKYVYSHTLQPDSPLVKSWPRTVVLNSPQAIRELKQQPGPDIQVWGSSQLAQLLLQHDLVDTLRLKIHPVILGRGKRLFAPDGIPANFVLVDSVLTPKGVFIGHYKRQGEVQTGMIGEEA